MPWERTGGTGQAAHRAPAGVPAARADAKSPAAELPGKAAERLEYEWGEQFDELDRQIGDLRKWFRRVEATTYRKEALILESDRDPVDVVLRRTEALLKDLKGKLAPGALAAEEKQLEALKHHEARADTFERVCQHLAANQIDINKTTLTLGPWLY